MKTTSRAFQPVTLNPERLYGSHWLLKPSATKIGANGKPTVRDVLQGNKISVPKPSVTPLSSAVKIGNGKPAPRLNTGK